MHNAAALDLREATHGLGSKRKIRAADLQSHRYASDPRLRAGLWCGSITSLLWRISLLRCNWLQEKKRTRRMCGNAENRKLVLLSSGNPAYYR